MKKIGSTELEILTKGDLIQYKTYMKENDDLYFDAVLEFDHIKKGTIEDLVCTELVDLIYCKNGWESKRVNFFLELSLTDEVFYIGPKEKFPEYCI
jgi:hypothetical protein